MTRRSARRACLLRRRSPSVIARRLNNLDGTLFAIDWATSNAKVMRMR